MNVHGRKQTKRKPTISRSDNLDRPPCSTASSTPLRPVLEDPPLRYHYTQRSNVNFENNEFDGESDEEWGHTGEQRQESRRTTSLP